MIYNIGEYIRYEIASGGSPAEEPVSLAEACSQLKLTVGDDDTHVNMLIKAARYQAEHVIGFPIISTTYIQYFESWPEYEEALYWGKVSSITSIKYNEETAGTLTTWDSSNYEVDKVMDRARFRLAKDKTWPALYDTINPVRVQYVAGYSDADAVPEDIKVAMLLMIGEMYERRENHVKNLPDAAYHMLMPYRLWVI